MPQEGFIHLGSSNEGSKHLILRQHIYHQALRCQKNCRWTKCAQKLQLVIWSIFSIYFLSCCKLWMYCLCIMPLLQKTSDPACPLQYSNCHRQHHQVTLSTMEIVEVKKLFLSLQGLSSMSEIVFAWGEKGPPLFWELLCPCSWIEVSYVKLLWRSIFF